MNPCVKLILEVVGGTGDKMKVEELLDEGVIDTIKGKIGAFAGKIMSSMTSLVTMFKKNPNVRLTTIEFFNVKEIGNTRYESRVDTGALVCAIHATDIKVDGNKVSFTHGSKEYNFPLLRMKEVKNANGISNRPRVALSYVWNGKTYNNIETSLTDRSKLKFQLLIGRNLISELKIPVHINDRDLKEE